MAEFDKFRQSRDVQAPTSGNSEGQQPTERAMRNSAETQPDINKWEEFMIKVIAWATDGSPTARHAFSVAKDLARMHAARLLVLHVQETGITRAGLLADENDHIPVALERVVTQLRDEGIDAELVVGNAPDGGCIVDQSDRAAHRRTPLPPPDLDPVTSSSADR